MNDAEYVGYDVSGFMNGTEYVGDMEYSRSIIMQTPFIAFQENPVLTATSF